eukprot:357824-Chlamydomonas_euryale.AAC.2
MNCTTMAVAIFIMHACCCVSNPYLGFVLPVPWHCLFVIIHHAGLVTAKHHVIWASAVKVSKVCQVHLEAVPPQIDIAAIDVDDLANWLEWWARL